jgi:hypothetical protein
MAGTRRLTVVTVFTVTGLLFSGGALKAFADDHGGGDRGGGNGHDQQRQVERAQPHAQVAAPRAEHQDAEHGRGDGPSKPVVVNVAAPPQGVTRNDEGDHGGGGGDHSRGAGGAGGGGGGGGDDEHRGPGTNAGPGHHDNDAEDEDENEHENVATATPTPTGTLTPTPTATATVTMTPTVVPEEEEELVTVINGVVFECEPTDNGQGRDHGRHLGELKHEDDEEAVITDINGVQFICEAVDEEELDAD